MNSFISKYYSVFFIVFLMTIVGLSFYIGYQEGSSANIEVKGEKQIVFSCPNTVLEKARISSVAKPLSSDMTASAYVDEVEEGAPDVATAKGVYMGSKNGTKYYTPGCPGSKRIKTENYIWFQSAEDAIVQGYSKGSC